MKEGESMARPMKAGLDYFPFDVDFFSDRKIKRLRSAFGADGVSVYLYLLCEIYRRGYYIEYDDDLILDISDELSITTNLTKQVLTYLFSRSLLIVKESKLAVPVKVITAESIQRRYQAAKKSAKRDIYVAAEFWVLDEEETESSVHLCPEKGNSRKNKDNSGKNPGYSRKNHTKESKVKESIVKESKEEKNEVTPSPVPTSPSALEELEKDYGRETVADYVRRAENWYKGKGYPLNDLYGTVRRWLEKDGVPKADRSIDKYKSVVNNFDLIRKQMMK